MSCLDEWDFYSMDSLCLILNYINDIIKIIVKYSNKSVNVLISLLSI